MPPAADDPRPCPRCDHRNAADASECGRCGVIFEKLLSPPVARPPASGSGVVVAPTVATVREPWGIDGEGRRALVFGAVAALVALWVPLSDQLFGYLLVLIHELGHSATGWLFAYPSIPAFDFVYGGGVSIHGERSTALLVVLLLAWGGLLYASRRQPRPRAVLALLAIAWLVAAFTPLHEILMVAMGHGMELLLAAVFLGRAASGRGCRVAVERPLYAFCGFFVLARAGRFAWGLATDPVVRQAYADAKGGGHWMDFSRLSHDYLGLDVATLAGLFLLACLATPLLAWWFERRRDRLILWLEGS